jgi:hypothetical protein
VVSNPFFSVLPPSDLERLQVGALRDLVELLRRERQVLVLQPQPHDGAAHGRLHPAHVDDVAGVLKVVAQPVRPGVVLVDHEIAGKAAVQHAGVERGQLRGGVGLRRRGLQHILRQPVLELALGHEVGQRRVNALRAVDDDDLLLLVGALAQHHGGHDERTP